MSIVYLNANEQGIVVFKVWKSLGYKTRLVISLGIILAGLVIQVFSYSLLPGAILLFLGNLLLLPSGYTNRVNLGLFDPQSDWEKVDRHKIDEFLTMDRKIRKWDRSAVDISNGLGGFLFFVIFIVLVFIIIGAISEGNVTWQILGVDTVLLLLPYWVTGLRSIFTVPKLTMKIKVVDTLLNQVSERLQNHKVDYYFLLKGKETRVPQDLKFKVNIARQHSDFLGFYGQITLNNVNSAFFPYFYIVLVARKGFGLERVYEGYTPPKTMVKEFKQQKDVEVLVLRQNTTVVKNGYCTRKENVEAIFLEGLALAEQAAPKSSEK